jgi:hypothetical protein
MWLSNGSVPQGRHAFTRVRDKAGLQTSVASLLLLRLPNAFLLCGVGFLLVGFGLLLGFAWRQDLQNTPGKDNNFAVMVMYIVVGGVAFLGTGGVLKWKMGEVHTAEKAVGKDIEDGGDEASGEGNGDGNTNRDDDSGDEGEGDALLGKRGKGETFSMKEVRDHERIAKALEDAAKAHRDLAKLMNDAIQGQSND